MFKSKTTMILQEEGYESAARSYAIDLLLNNAMSADRAWNMFEENFPNYTYVFNEVLEDVRGIGGV